MPAPLPADTEHIAQVLLSDSNIRCVMNLCRKAQTVMICRSSEAKSEKHRLQCFFTTMTEFSKNTEESGRLQAENDFYGRLEQKRVTEDFNLQRSFKKLAEQPDLAKKLYACLPPVSQKSAELHPQIYEKNEF